MITLSPPLSLFLVFLQQRGCELLPVGKVQKGQKSFFFFHAEPVGVMWPISVIWDGQHEIFILIHMLSLFFT